MFALIDGDSIIYKAACSVQKTIHKGFDEVGKLLIESHQLRLVKSHGEVSEIRSTIEAEPVSHALHNVKRLIQRILDETEASDYIIALTHTDKDKNFRHKVSGNREYKANRVQPKPVHFDKVRAYVFKHFKCKEVEGYEAEDYVAIMSGILTKQGIENCIVGIDKDLWMIPGLHYNYDKQKWFTVSDPGDLELISKEGKKVIAGTGFKWFCAQMLLGDPVDNIEGLKGYGSVKTYDRLKDITTVKSLWAYVSALYRFKGKTEQELLGTKDLLWIKRSK